ncbi:MAG TPA: cyclopropane-fatty-acyl-phospholipid synthase family protein [Chthonomonas sp.]|uniref:cyclopropane-fatty-acyl-phospholipid synthase family protein n=1 Tax=Chthonomonas sp. TaxID=2282153 RepID=UPI002B4ABC2C|nr:cyclopropane-fatty-acyl-phospholipid synthase family protein [Chthonomonas sp.]HLI48126.1 cyclopropane-fatty-acyl-phospholipid synthase family protein [Chthonomonas sp.]
MDAKTLLHGLFSRARGDPFVVTYWDGCTYRYGEEGEPVFTVKLLKPVDIGAFIENMALAFGEAYMNGDIEVEGDLADLVAMALRNIALEATWRQRRALRVLGRVAGHAKRSLRKQQEDVAAHYDLGNAFFRLWLDETMTYSCAFFRTPNDTIEEAQRNKMDYSLKKLRLRPGETLLDIGSGWGALILRAAEKYGVYAMGITLSREQYNASLDAIKARGLEDRVQVRLQHYQQLADEGLTFDKIISIGMIEHVGKAHLKEFVSCVRKLLAPQGVALLHHITLRTPTPEYALHTISWEQKYIFPGGYIPTLPEMLTHLSEQGFIVLDVENLRPHYRLTLDRWSERFEQNVEKVRAMYGERFVRMWRLYLRGASAAFRVGTHGVHQTLVSKEVIHSLPLTRADICP